MCIHIIMHVIVLVEIENSAGIIIVQSKINYNDVRILSIESVKKQKLNQDYIDLRS